MKDSFHIAVVLLFLRFYSGDTVVLVTDYGTDATMRCVVNSDSYQWTKLISGSYQNLQSSSKYSMSGRSLTIHNTNLNDNGFYQCVLLRRGGSISGSETPIELEVKVNGGWSTWSNNDTCTVTCGDGTRTRTRACNNPPPSNSGIYCPGLSSISENCNEFSCSVNGGWSTWSEMSMCTVTCGYGTRTKTRACINPPPSGGGSHCPGLTSDSENCNNFPCPVNGGWSTWSYLDTCSATCGYGTRTKTRSCNNPPPSGSGLYCPGLNYDSENCNESVCPVNGGWSTWSYLDICSATCGYGTRTKTRSCNNPPPSGSGSNCPGLSSKSENCNSLPCLESGEDKSENIHVPLVIGTVSGVITIVLAILTLVVYAKRRWCKSKRELDYEKTDITRVKSHTYEETHVNPMYQNDQQGADIEVTVMENTYCNEANLVERYDVSDLTNQFRNKECLLRKLRAEFKLLNNSTGDPKLYNSEYEIVDTRRNKEENKLYLKGSTLDVLHNNNVSVLLEIPQNSLAEQFWTLIDDHSIENIILLVKENEKVSEFYPTLDDIFKMNSFEISLDSAERTHKIIMMLTFNLQNKTKQTIRNVKIYKTNVSDVPTVQAMCYILDKASEMREAPVMIMNSEMADLSVCGVLTVCLNVMFAIKTQSPFSVLENAMILHKQDRRFFKNVDDYELCYKVIGNYLEAVNTYDCID